MFQRLIHKQQMFRLMFQHHAVNK